MNAPSTEQPRIFARKAAMRLGEAILIGFAVIIVLAGIDNAQRSKLETFQEVTAVGDRAVFPIPAQVQKPPVAAVSFRGQPLYPVSYEPVEIRDTKMIRLGRDDNGQYFVYGTRENVPPQEGETVRKGETFFFLKVEPNKYLKTRTSTPGK
ncbi:hypothetical protein ACXR0O_16905 [Verrucomicrobiota bacterium sgz303538]